MPEEMEAEELFVLMTDRYRVSRNTRARWFFDKINSNEYASNKLRLSDFNEEIEIVSMTPRNYQDDLLASDDISEGVEDEYSCRGPFKITHNTKVTFLARRYR